MSERWLNDAVAAHRGGRLAEAESLYLRVLDSAPAQPQALANLAMLYQGRGELDRAIATLAGAARNGHLDPSALNTLGGLCREAGRPEEARPAYAAAIASDPGHVNARFNLAAVERALGDLDAAITTLRALVAIAPSDPEALAELATALVETGAVEEATDLLRAALRIDPSDPRTHYNLAAALGMQGAVDAAEQAYRAAVRIEPRFAEAHNNLGLLLKGQGEREQALACFKAAASANPGHVSAYLNWLDVAPGEIDFAAFERACRAALAADPVDQRALQGLGKLLVHTGRSEEAIVVLRRAREAHPDDVALACDLGIALQKAGDLDAAIDVYGAVSELSQLYPLAQNNLAHCLQIQGRIEPAVAACRRALAAKPHYAACHSNLLLCLEYRDGDAHTDLRDEHAAWARRHAVPAPRPEPTRRERLTIGYVSADFRSHPVADFIAGIFRHHDRARFEIVGYSNVEQPDDFTRRIAGLVDRWRDIRALDDDTAARLIERDGVDILIDLSGHTGDHRLGIFARRPAPVQVSYLGYPNTTGLDAVDFRVTDARADPPGETETFHAETLLRLPSGFLCYRPEQSVAEVTAARAADTPVTFGSFNNTSKVSDATVAAWAEILLRTPDARLLLKSRQLTDAGTRAHLHERFTAAGVDATRIVLEGGMLPHPEHLASYARVDIALDPFPYNGTTTTCEALAAGVPVVTLAGRTHRARVGASLLGRLGLDGLVANSTSEYVDIAAGLAADPAARSEVAGSVTATMRAGALADAATLTGELEAGLREAFDRVCDAARAPEPDAALRLNIGGTEAAPGWLNFNILEGPAVDIVGDCRDLGAIEDASLAEVYTSHTLEHLGYESDLPRAIAEMHRVLRPGGTLKVSVPDLELLSRKLLDPALDEGLRWQVMRMMFGGQIDEHDYHKVGLTFASLRRLLAGAGFTDVERVDRFGLFDDTSDGHIGGDPISLNVVARK